MNHKTAWLVVITAVLASLLEIIDSSIVNVALPHMQGNLGVTLSQVSWVSTGYIISNAVVLPIAAWLGAKIGRKTYYTACILLFTVSSLLCGLAPNFIFLVLARVLQGIAGGALLPTSQLIIQEQFPGERSGIGSAIYGVSVMVGPAIGPTLGGYLTDTFDWRYIFFINIPIGAVACFLSYLSVEDQEDKSSEKKKNSPVDWIGFALLILGIGSLQYLLERGQEDDWFSSNLILISAVVSAISLPLFFAYEWQKKDPLVNVKLFKESPVWGSCLLMAATGLILYAVIFLIPVFTDRALGMDATSTGLLYLPSSLLTMCTMPFVGLGLAKIGPKPFITAGILLVCFSLWRLSHFTSLNGGAEIVSAFYTRGIGMACIFVPINAMALSQYKGETVGQVSGLLNLSRQLGGSIGIAAISTYLDRFSAQFRNELRANLTSTHPSSMQALQAQIHALPSRMQSQVGLDEASLGLGHGSLAALKGMMGQMEKQVFQLSFNRLMAVLTFIYLLALIPLYLLKLKNKVGSPAAVE